MVRKKQTITLPEPPRALRVAAYGRVSSGKDAMLDSLSNQVSYDRSLIQNHLGWRYMGVYADEALTGTKDSRPEFQRLLADCRAGKIDLILVKALSRLARNTVTLLDTVRELKALSVDIWFERENIHTMSAEGEVLLTLIAAAAQEESRSVSENCKWRIRNEYRQGHPVSLSLYGYILTTDGLMIVADEAEVVRRIFQLALAGKGRRTIARQLQSDGIEPPYSEQWQESTVMYILQNEKYIGEMRLQKTFIADHLTKQKLRNKGQMPDYYVTDSHEPIVDRDVFDAVQHLIAERRAKLKVTTATPARYPLSGIVKCGICGAHYQRKIGNAGGKYASPVWVCATKKLHGKHACSAKQIPENVLMDIVAEHDGVLGIIVPGPNQLIIHLANGEQVERTWQDHSRRDSWDEAAREQARQQAKERCSR